MKLFHFIIHAKHSEPIVSLNLSTLLTLVILSEYFLALYYSVRHSQVSTATNTKFDTSIKVLSSFHLAIWLMLEIKCKYLLYSLNMMPICGINNLQLYSYSFNLNFKKII